MSQVVKSEDNLWLVWSTVRIGQYEPTLGIAPMKKFLSFLLENDIFYCKNAIFCLKAPVEVLIQKFLLPASYSTVHGNHIITRPGVGTPTDHTLINLTKSGHIDSVLVCML